MPMQLKLTTQTCRIQQFYHLLKTHKARPKIQPIISGSGGPFDRLGWFMQLIIRQLLQYASSHLFNTTELFNAIKSLPLHERAGTIPISLDIVSMYTNIRIDDGIQTVLESVSYTHLTLPTIYSV